MRTPKNLLVTGGSGFIGSNFINYMFADENFAGAIVNFDKLTYAGNPLSLSDVEAEFGGIGRYHFVLGDIVDRNKIEEVFDRYDIDAVIHFAAESHVDRSIYGPKEFVQTNIIGTFNLLEVARARWDSRDDVLFHHVSTDEVFGSLPSEGFFSESTHYDPRSPYSASKASSDHLARAYFYTYGLPVTISNCSNNYGPYQFPEKLIPVMIENLTQKKKLPVYGDGKNIRDWLYVEDHASAISAIVALGKTGETYNIGGENEWQNIRLVYRLCELVASEIDDNGDDLKELIDFVPDRPGHDRRYAIDCTKIKSQLGWKQSVTFDEGLRSTVRWYLENREWVESVKTGDYREWIDQNYRERV